MTEEEYRDLILNRPNLKIEQMMSAILVEICDEVDSFEYAEYFNESKTDPRDLLKTIRGLMDAEFNPADLRGISLKG